MNKKRLPQFEYLDSEMAKAALEIPEEAEIINITDKFKDGGPIVISYFVKADEQERMANIKSRDIAIDRVLRSVGERLKEVI